MPNADITLELERPSISDRFRTISSIRATREAAYTVISEVDVLAPDGYLAGYIGDGRTPLLVVDEAVAELAADRLSDFYDALPIAPEVVLLKGGEPNKDLPAALDIVAAMDRIGTLRRSTPVIVIGGGVVCDIVGLAASIYRRGIPYVRVPTTLLSQVDVSIAIKSGVNHGGFRNRIGSFWAPVTTIIDPTFLATQRAEEISQGLGEILKLAMVCSAELFSDLEHLPVGWTPQWLAENPHSHRMMERAIIVMADELRNNLWEENLQRVVDYGHSFSPLIEMNTGIHHGFAVALDCLLSMCIAVDRGVCAGADLDRVVRVMRRTGLPTRHPAFADVDQLWESLAETVRHRNGKQHLPLPTSIGSHVFIDDLRRDELPSAIARMVAVADRAESEDWK